MVDEDAVARGLCDVMERALVDSGLNPSVARELARRACMPSVAGATRSLKKKAKKANTKLSRAFKEANNRLRTKSGKLRRGITQSDVAKLAHRIAKKL